MHFAEVASKVPSTYMNEWDGKRGSGSLWLQLYPGLEHKQGYGWLYLIAARLRGRPCILYHVRVAGEIGSVELERAHLPYRQAGICFTSSGQREISFVAGTQTTLGNADVLGLTLFEVWHVWRRWYLRSAGVENREHRIWRRDLDVEYCTLVVVARVGRAGEQLLKNIYGEGARYVHRAKGSS